MKLPAVFLRFIFPALAGLALALVWPGDRHKATSKDESASDSFRRSMPSGSAATVTERSSVRSESSANDAFSRAWKQLLRERDDSEDVWKRRQALLKDWADHDLRAALAAALEAGGNLQPRPYDPDLLTAFDDTIRRRPQEFLDLLKGDPFGLDSGLARRHALEVISRSDPGFLASILGQLGRSDRVAALGFCLDSEKLDAQQREELIRSLGELPDDATNRGLLQAAGQRLAELDGQELLSRYSAAGTDGERRILSSALQAKLLSGKSTREEMAAQLQAMPGGLASEILDRTLEAPGTNTGVFTLALDRMFDQPGWKEREREFCVKLHNIQAEASPAQSEELIQWAQSIPEREECEDIYRVALRFFVLRDAETALQRIEGMEAGWKRDNALVAVVNGTTHPLRDETITLRALDQIQSEHFRAQAAATFERAKMERAQK